MNSRQGDLAGYRERNGAEDAGVSRSSVPAMRTNGRNTGFQSSRVPGDGRAKNPTGGNLKGLSVSVRLGVHSGRALRGWTVAIGDRHDDAVHGVGPESTIELRRGVLKG